MNEVKHEHLTPGKVYMVTATTGACKGLVGRLMKVKAVEGAFCVMTFTGAVGELLAPSIYVLAEFTFALPSPAFMQAALPDECWEETLDILN